MICREHETATGPVQGLPLRVALPSNDTAASPEASNIYTTDSPSAIMPELITLRGFDQVTLVNRLQKAVQHTMMATELSSQDAADIYALSARIELPLHGDTAAAYRALLRKCKEWRAKSEASTDPLLPHLNVLIALAGGFFRQDEELSALWGDEVDFPGL